MYSTIQLNYINFDFFKYYKCPLNKEHNLLLYLEHCAYTFKKTPVWLHILSWGKICIWNAIPSTNTKTICLNATLLSLQQILLLNITMLKHTYFNKMLWLVLIELSEKKMPGLLGTVPGANIFFDTS